MYANQSPSGQWNQNATPTSQAQSQGHWSPQPPNGQYAPRPNQIPPISQALPQQGPAMQTLQPGPDQYRSLPPPQHLYGPPYQQAPPMGYLPQQPAPRQRTAIACRYCRRRKIRCSGFDQSEDGRCTNCQRFSQECIFTPVSAQTQAFVPAHTVWRGQNPPQGAQLYGAYGQPLPPQGANRDPYPPPQQQPGQYPPPPQGYQQPPMYAQPPAQQGQTPQAGQKRGSDEPHTPTLPPPNPGAQLQIGQQPYYPEAPAGAFFASPSASLTIPAQPYYPDVYHTARASPQSPYSHALSSHLFGQPGSPASAMPSNELQPVGDGQTSPPGSTQGNIQSAGSKTKEGLAQQTARALLKQEERTRTDSSMVQALNRRDHAGDPTAENRAPIPKKPGVDVGVQTDESGINKPKELAS